MAEGLRHSVCIVQHDNPWTIGTIDEMARADGDCSVSAKDHAKAAPPPAVDNAWNMETEMEGALDAGAADAGTEAMCISLHQPYATLLVCAFLKRPRAWSVRARIAANASS